MPKVLNKHTDNYQYGDIYIGRESKWGNPFTHLKHLEGNGNLVIVSSREEAISCYKIWFLEQPKLMEAAKQELKGKNLICYCAPLACHGDFLLKFVNEKND